MAEGYRETRNPPGVDLRGGPSNPPSPHPSTHGDHLNQMPARWGIRGGGEPARAPTPDTHNQHRYGSPSVSMPGWSGTTNWQGKACPSLIPSSAPCPASDKQKRASSAPGRARGRGYFYIAHHDAYLPASKAHTHRFPNGALTHIGSNPSRSLPPTRIRRS